MSKNYYIPRWSVWVAIIAAILLVVLFSSCYTAKKAKAQFGKSVTAYPILGADYCSRTYPTVPKTDSSAYIASKKAIDSLAGALRADSLLSQQERDRLIVEIQRIRAAIPEPQNCDSLFDAIYRLAAQEKQRADKLQDANYKLIVAANSLKPIIDTVVDKAALDKCEIIRDEAVQTATREHTELLAWKGKARKRMWMLIGIGIVGILTLAGIIYRKTKKTVPIP